MEYSKIKLRGQAQREGVWFQLGDGFEVKLRSTSSEEGKNAINSAVDRRRKALGLRQGRELPIDEAEDAVRSVVFGKILIDWRGLTESGSPMPCTRENFDRICQDEPAFLNRIMRLAGDEYEYSYEDLEVVEGD